MILPFSTETLNAHQQPQSQGLSAPYSAELNGLKLRISWHTLDIYMYMHYAPQNGSNILYISTGKIFSVVPRVTSATG